jgi:Sec-independent protein secretion pathway component TatC
MMALPMIALYNMSILLAWRVTARRERAEAAQRAREDAPAGSDDDPAQAP